MSATETTLRRSTRERTHSKAFVSRKLIHVTRITDVI